MKYIGENAIKKLIALIKSDLAKKQNSITVSGLLKGDGTTISAAVAEMDYMAPPTGGTAGQILKKTETGTEWADASFKPEGKSYLTFSSPNSFTLSVNNADKNWDGTLEYFASDKTWTVWDGTTTLSAVDDDGEYVLYLRGTGNTVITGNNQNYRWVLTGTEISCIGNIENLLDFATVQSGNHPTLAPYCYRNMFDGCTSLIKAPAIPATTLASYCYRNMFKGCTSLIQAPALPATTLAPYCYSYMFQGCTSLTQAPALPATTLADYCYYHMFQGCTSLIQAPALPATTLAPFCYSIMFYNCTALTQAPALPATTLAGNCYYQMFNGCTALTQAPALPATTLADYCYTYMFSGCTSLTQAPSLPAITLARNCYNYMFLGCTSLTKAPSLPVTTLTDYCYHSMFKGCTNIKLSSTQTGEYTQEYRIPASGTGTTASDALTDMFTSTGGTFTGTPSINTTYYLSSDNMVVHDTEVATLREYVGSMIDSNSDVFIATYGTTTGTEIWDAYRAGKTIFANKSGRYGLLAGEPTSVNNISFYCVYNGADYDSETYETYAEYPIYELWICQGNSWKIGAIAKDAPLHSSTHASGGSDPITPADIGAATMAEVNAAIQTAIGNAIGGSY